MMIQIQQQFMSEGYRRNVQLTALSNDMVRGGNLAICREYVASSAQDNISSLYIFCFSSSFFVDALHGVVTNETK